MIYSIIPLIFSIYMMLDIFKLFNLLNLLYFLENMILFREVSDAVR